MSRPISDSLRVVTGVRTTDYFDILSGHIKTVASDDSATHAVSGVRTSVGNRHTPTEHRFLLNRRVSLGFKQRNTFGSGGEWGYQNITGHVLPVDTGYMIDPEWTLQDESCMSKQYDKIRAGANLAVDLAEGKQTLKLVKQVLLAGRTIRNIVKRLKRDPIGIVAETWLQYRYGVMPLIHSTYDILDAILAREADRSVVFVTRSGRKKTEFLWRKTGEGSFYNPIEEVWYDFDSARTEIGISWKRPKGGIADWTSLNPLGIAWELVPLSFVADWFLNVGDTLQAWENYVLFSNSFQWGWKTRTQRAVVRTKTYGRSSSAPVYWPNGNLQDGYYDRRTESECIMTKSFFHRIRLDSLIQPSGLRVTCNLNWKRYSDAASLLYGFSSRRVR